MGTRWEAVEAKYSGVDWHTPLEEIENWGMMDPGQYGISVGDGVMIHGTADELVDWAESVLEHAKKAQAHAAKPLGREDFEPDEDGDYRCPRCEVAFQPVGYSDLREMLRAIDAHREEHNGAA